VTTSTYTIIIMCR